MTYGWREQEDAVRRRWPQAILMGEEYGKCAVTLPDIRLPMGWTPETATVLFTTPPGFPGATPYDWFETAEEVRVLGVPPFRSWRTDAGGTRFRWFVQDWNPNYCGLHTLARVCLLRFGNAKAEVDRIRWTDRVLREAAEDNARAYAAYDRLRGRAR